LHWIVDVILMQRVGTVAHTTHLTSDDEDGNNVQGVELWTCLTGFSYKFDKQVPDFRQSKQDRGRLLVRTCFALKKHWGQSPPTAARNACGPPPPVQLGDHELASGD
jgi:hypothetical protein